MLRTLFLFFRIILFSLLAFLVVSVVFGLLLDVPGFGILLTLVHLALVLTLQFYLAYCNEQPRGKNEFL
jgi:hypothetical protein